MKNINQQKRIWLVGASQGIGLELTKLWLSMGYRVVASSRQAEESAELALLKVQYQDQLVCLNIDISQPNTCTEKVEEAWQAFKGLDLWFYNVGTYQPMTTDQWDWESFVSMNQTNYLGVVALMLPLQKLFQQQGEGRWVWNASLAAYFGLPYGGAYSAPKAALINLAEALQPELAKQGIKLQLVNHGFVRTRLTAKNAFSMPGLLEPEAAAKLIVNGIEKNKHFELRFPKRLRLVLSLLKCLPYAWALRLTKKMLKDSI